MHEELLRTLLEDKLEAMMEEVGAQAGALKSIEFVGDEFGADGEHMLVLSYRVDCENALLDATVKFQFVGLKGHLLGFQFKDAPPDDPQN